MQTTVEWLAERLESITQDLFQEALEMEKQQIMTLYEKFEKLSFDMPSEDCEKIADNYAVGFANWYEEEILAKGDYNMIDKPKKELLEMYKKEVGL